MQNEAGRSTAARGYTGTPLSRLDCSGAPAAAAGRALPRSRRRTGDGAACSGPRGRPQPCGAPAQAGSAHNTSNNGTLFVVATAAPLQAPAAAPRPLMTWAITNTASLSASVRRALLNPTMPLISAC
jgi:hypothetical protein